MQATVRVGGGDHSKGRVCRYSILMPHMLVGTVDRPNTLIGLNLSRDLKQPIGRLDLGSVAASTLGRKFGYRIGARPDVQPIQSNLNEGLNGLVEKDLSQCR